MVFAQQKIKDNTASGAKWVRVGSGTGIGGGNGGDTYISYNPTTFEINYTDAEGHPQIINLHNVVKATETLTSLTDNKDGTVTYRDEHGNSHRIVLANGPAGADGKSAFEIWLELPGNAGKSEADFIASLKGEQGIQGGNRQHQEGWVLLKRN